MTMKDMRDIRQLAASNGVSRRTLVKTGLGVLAAPAVLRTIPANAQNPVLAHLFLDWMMTYKNAMLNFTWNGYQPPQRKADPATLTTTDSYYGEPYVFPWLSDAVVHESDFHTGYFQEELTPQVDQLWHNAWQAFNSA